MTLHFYLLEFSLLSDLFLLGEPVLQGLSVMESHRHLLGVKHDDDEPPFL